MRNALLLAAALFAAPAAVMAEGISYSYVDGRYFSTDSDAMNVNLRGGVLSGSLALGSIFFVSGDGQYAESEKVTVGTASGRFDFMAASARIGAHYPITNVLDIVASGGALYNEVKGKGALNGADDDDIGYIGEAGLRLALTPQIEVAALYNYQDINDSTESSFTGDLQYHFTPQFSLVGSATNARSIDVYSVGARFHF